MNYNAVSTRENVKIIDSSANKSMKIFWNIRSCLAAEAPILLR